MTPSPTYNDDFHEPRPDCLLKFDMLMAKQQEHDKEFRAHREFRENTGVDLATLAAKLDGQSSAITALSESVAGTNKVLLGLGTSALLLSIGFVIWFIQNLDRFVK